MTKKNGWRTHLNGFLGQIGATPFSFGTHDCAVGLAFPVIEMQTGIDLGAPFRGKYSTFLDGAKLYMQAGFEDLEALLRSHFREYHPSAAQVGDIASLPGDPIGWSLGVVLGERIGVLNVTGYCTIERSRALRTFRIE